MYLLSTDLIAIVIALTASTTLVITTAIANARLSRKVSELRAQLASIYKLSE
jgi:hypothetical protein